MDRSRKALSGSHGRSRQACRVSAGSARQSGTRGRVGMDLASTTYQPVKKRRPRQGRQVAEARLPRRAQVDPKTQIADVRRCAFARHSSARLRGSRTKHSCAAPADRTEADRKRVKHHILFGDTVLNVQAGSTQDMPPVALTRTRPPIFRMTPDPAPITLVINEPPANQGE